MPIYEYECCKCGQHSEAWQRFSDAPLIKCELCRGRLRKIISHTTFHLKGTGWYVTDYASKGGESNGKKKETPAESKKVEPSAPGKDSSTGTGAKTEP